MKTFSECIDEINRLRQVCKNVYELWAGSEGIPLPETASEAYLLRLVEVMRDEAISGLNNAGIEEAKPKSCVYEKEYKLDSRAPSYMYRSGCGKLTESKGGWNYCPFCGGKIEE